MNTINSLRHSVVALTLLGSVVACASAGPSNEESTDEASSASSPMMCGQAFTCCGGLLYPNTCCGKDGSRSYGKCSGGGTSGSPGGPSDPGGPGDPGDPGSSGSSGMMCGQAFTCCGGVLYPNTCCGKDGSPSYGKC